MMKSSAFSSIAMILTAAAAAAAALIAGLTYAEAGDRPFAEGVVSADGSIRVPKSFRTDYVLLGAWSVAGDADTGSATGLHVVYAPREAVDGYRRTGAFPDGTVLVKELFNGRTEQLTTGTATSAAATAGYFVMVKDREGRFPEHPLWGDGWGWSYFPANDTERTTTKAYAQECLACHLPAGATDFIYTRAYPVLE